MALIDLIAALDADVSQKATAELEAGRAEAATLRADAEAALEAQRETARAQHEAELRQTLRSEHAQRRTQLRAELLHAREAVIDRVLDAARERLGELASSATYRSALPAELEDALSYVTGEVTVRCAPDLADDVARCCAGRSIRIEPDTALAAGFLVSAEGGRIEVDKTLASRLHAAQPALRTHIVRRVDDGAESDPDVVG